MTGMTSLTRRQCATSWSSLHWRRPARLSRHGVVAQVAGELASRNSLVCLAETPRRSSPAAPRVFAGASRRQAPAPAGTARLRACGWRTGWCARPRPTRRCRLRCSSATGRAAGARPGCARRSKPGGGPVSPGRASSGCAALRSRVWAQSQVMSSYRWLLWRCAAVAASWISISRRASRSGWASISDRPPILTQCAVHSIISPSVTRG